MKTNSSTNKNIVITGGAGYIGSATAHGLRKSGYNPILFDIKNPPQISNSNVYQYELINILNTNHLVLLLKKYKPVCVIHLASSIDVEWCEENPSACNINNTQSGISLLNAMKVLHLDNLLFSSSAAVYADSNAPVSSFDKTEPKNNYGKSKLELERHILQNARETGMVTAILRYFNVFGNTNTSIKKNSATQNNLFANILKVIAKQKRFLNIKIGPFDDPNPWPTRDYIHVGDIVETNIRAISHMLTTKKSLVLPVGTGLGHSTKELLLGFEEAFGYKIPVNISPAPAYELISSIANPTELKKTLHYVPKQYTAKEIVLSGLQLYT